MRPVSPELVGVVITSALTLLAAVYHMGIRRERVDNIKHGLTLEVRSLRENNNQRFDRVELRLTSIEGQITAINDRHAESERWRGRMDSAIQLHEDSLCRMERDLSRAAT